MRLKKLLKRPARMLTHDFPCRNQQGMTLIEILAVLTLLGIIATFLIKKIGGKLDEGKIEATKIQIQNVVGNLEDFKRHCNRFPTTEEGLEALVKKPASLSDCKRYRPEGYFDTNNNQQPEDSFGHKFSYKSPDNGRTFEIKSLGSDGIEGGEGIDADISNKDL